MYNENCERIRFSLELRTSSVIFLEAALPI